MKNLFKSLGAAIGYLALYLAVTIIVTLVGMVAHLLTYLSLDEAMKFIMSNLIEFSIIANVFTLAVCILIQKLARKRKVMEYLEIRHVVFKRLWPVFILGVSLNVIFIFILSMLPLPKEVMDDYSRAVGVLGEGSVPVTLISTVVVAPIFEEILYRGLIFNALRKAMPVWVAVILQAILFGVSHGQIVWMSYAFALGIILALIRLRYKSIIPAIAVHFAFNGLSGLMMAARFDMPQSVPMYIAVVAAAFLLAGFSSWMIHRYMKADASAEAELPVPEPEQ